MKTIRYAMGLATVVYLLASGSGLAQTIRMVQYQAPPYAADNLPEGGFYCQLAKEAFAIYGHDVTVSWRPLKRAFAMVKEGTADLSLGFLKIPQRERSVLFSTEPIASSPVAIFYLKAKGFNWDTLEDLQGLRIGDRLGNVNGGSDYLAAEQAGRLTIERVTTDAQNISKLLMGRIDVLIGAASMIKGALRASFSREEQDQIAMHPKPLHVVYGFAIFNRRLSPQLIDAFNSGVRKLRENGRFDQLSPDTGQDD